MKKGNASKVITQPVIFCPLCIKVYHADALGQDGIDSLTIEHIPPESVGGKAKVLTCKLLPQFINGYSLSAGILLCRQINR